MATNMAAPAGRCRLPAAERRKRIIAAARAVFVEESLRGARTKEIAARAGVTEAFLYRHFDSKDAMYAAAVLDPVREAIAILAADVERIDAEVADPVEFIRQVHRRCFEHHVEYGALQAVALFGDPASGRVLHAETLQPSLDRMGRLVAEHAGWAGRGLDPVIVRRVVFGAQWAISLDHAMRDEVLDVDALAATLTTLFTSGVGES